MLEGVELSDEPEDIRIINMAFMAVGDLGLEDLLQRGVRIRIILTNPKNKALIQSRSVLRKDVPPGHYQQLIDSNISNWPSSQKQAMRENLNGD